MTIRSSSLAVARLLQGNPLELQGRLLTDRREDGSLALLDPTTGNELRAEELPAFVLSTEGEATDGNILRQFWNLERANAAGVPVLWGHNPDRLLGQWRSLEVIDLNGERVLVGRADLDLALPEGETRRRQIREGYLSAVSVRWTPGELVRRGELDESDPLYREPEDDWCDMPAEGYVMGSERSPNTLIECSLVTTPADPRAIVTARAQARAAASIDQALRGGPADLDRILPALGGDDRVRGWARNMLRAELAELLTVDAADVESTLARLLGAAPPAPTSPPPPAPEPTPEPGPRRVADLFARSAS